MKRFTVMGTLFALALALPATAFAAEAPRSAQRGAKSDCRNCAPARRYDTQEVIKNTREIETNHLVVHENETRHVGTVQHNHTIIEKEVVLTKRNVDHKTVNTVVDLVEHKYNTVRQRIVEEREIPGKVRYLNEDRRPRAINSYRRAPNYIKPRGR
jgi:transcriptional regulator NrdR family protein